MINYKQENFFEQYLDVYDMPLTSNPDFILNKFNNMKILHIGCVDSLYYNKDRNLHIQLSRITKSLFGYDIDINGLKQLEKDCPSVYFSNFDDVLSQEYDLVLVPEVIEHVNNVESFMDNLFSIKTKEYFITAPYIGLFNSNIKHSGTRYKELVHPDHKCWHSPYTLLNTCNKLLTKYPSSNTDMYILKSTSVAIHIK